MNLDAYTFHGGSCIDSKRVYSSAVFSWFCPSCETKREDQFNQSPLIYAGHCHKFYCHNCEYESDEYMYSIDRVNFDSVDISCSKDNSLEVFKLRTVMGKVE